MLRRSAEHVMINMVIAIFERLKNLEDEWQFVDTPNETTTNAEEQQPADPHMSTPKPSPSPTLQQQQQDSDIAAAVAEEQQFLSVDSNINNEKQQQTTTTTTETVVLTESLKAEEPQVPILDIPSPIDPTPEITAGKKKKRSFDLTREKRLC
jgi:hypothetical protein